MKPMRFSLAGLIFLAGCATTSTPQQLTSDPAPDVWARLPQPVSNNAVAGVMLDGRMMAYSFAGLHAGKTYRDVTADAYACDLEAANCREIAGLPDGIGRLAAVAATVNGQIYIFGGYTVAEDGSERSTPDVFRFDPARERYERMADMPVPVDDSVALVWQDRYVYLISGWHDVDNVSDVQVLDTQTGDWLSATPYPGAPVFGHSAAMIEGGAFEVCGGVRVVQPVAPQTRRSFSLSPECWFGQIAENDPRQITWSAYTGGMMPGRYRAAATTWHQEIGNETVAFGGTLNPYNFNGIGYNGDPSEPVPGALRSNLTFHHNAQAGDYVTVFQDRPPTMDHRGVIAWPIDEASGAGRYYQRRFVTLGGMTAGQEVIDWVIVSEEPPRPES